MGIAEAFSALSNYPVLQPAINAIAELLVRICATEEQATWLYEEVCLSGRHTRWGGPGWLRDIWAGEFDKWAERQPYRSPERTPESEPLCEVCQSLGHYFDLNMEQHTRCGSCHHGAELSQKVLDLMNGHWPQAVIEREKRLGNLGRITQQDIDRLMKFKNEKIQ